MKLYMLVGLRVVLVVTLAFFAVNLAINLNANHNEPSYAAATLEANKRMVFRTELGVDINGTLITPLPPPNVQRTVVFLLRRATLSRDLEFWTAVSKALPRDAHIRLLAYCDSSSCIDAERSTPAPFPIIEFGEAISSQALLNADQNGKALLISEAWLRPKDFTWRGSTLQSPLVVREILN